MKIFTKDNYIAMARSMLRIIKIERIIKTKTKKKRS